MPSGLSTTWPRQAKIHAPHGGARWLRRYARTVTNSLSQTLHHFLLLCVHTLFYTHTKVSSPHTAAPDPIFLARRLRRRFTVSQHTNTEIAGISVFSVSKCAMSAGAGGPRCSVSRACCLRKYASPTPQQNREWTSLRKYAPETTGERIAKICAPPKSHYPRMDIS